MEIKERNEVLKEVSFSLGDKLGGSTCRSCDKAYCCEHQSQVGISSIEFDIIAHLVTNEQIARAQVEVDKLDNLEKQWVKENKTDSDRGYRCPFLSEEGRCEIYENRFIVCASYSVISKEHNCSATLCDKDSSVQIVDPNAIFMSSMNTNKTVVDKILEVIPEDIIDDGTDIISEFVSRYLKDK